MMETKTGFEVEHGVPIPPPMKGRMRKYPWRELGVGDSFFVPGGKSSVFANHAHYQGKRGGTKFVTRVMVVDGVRGVRVWRIE